MTEEVQNLAEVDSAPAPGLQRPPRSMSLLAKVFNHHDKIAHFSVGVIVYAMLHFINPITGMVGVVAVAFGKEGYDYRHRDKHTPDLWDAVATIFGGIIGFICSI